jgi:hypothetical protein
MFMGPLTLNIYAIKVYLQDGKLKEPQVIVDTGFGAKVIYGP